jgi:thiol-disulfide isomerase/thioredoxin
VTVQAVLVGIYWLVEQRRNSVPEPELNTAPPKHVDGRLPPLSLRDRSGDRLELSGIAGPTLVHFWATWCAPCRVELPGLLALPETHPVQVVAVALDREWADVERFLEGHDLSNVYRADAAEVEAALNVRSLPVTYLVESSGQLRLRFDGSRDWTDARFLRAWIKDNAVSP